MPPVTVISASPPSNAAVTIPEDEIKTKWKSRLYFLNNPASCAIHGIDRDMTRAEWMPTNLSAAVPSVRQTATAISNANETPNFHVAALVRFIKSVQAYIF